MSLRRYYLYCHNMSIKVTDEEGFELHGSNDQFIMQPHHLERYSASQQRDLNLVRLYLQVNTLAEMADTSSRKQSMNLDYFDAVRPPGFVEKACWLRLEAPSKAQRRLWKRFIRASYLRYVPYWLSDPLLAGKSSNSEGNQGQAVRINDFDDHLQSLSKSHQRLLDGYQQLASDKQVWKAFRSRRRLHFATDGGLHSQKGTHGWVIST